VPASFLLHLRTQDFTVCRAGRDKECALYIFWRRLAMTESVYKVIELIGASTDSWEKAAAAAVERAGQSLRDLRVAEVKELDLVIENGKVTAYRAKLNVSFKFEKD